jgi:peptidoglycan/LPS O-acetylase OafA/YrhL
MHGSARRKSLGGPPGEVYSADWEAIGDCGPACKITFPYVARWGKVLFAAARFIPYQGSDLCNPEEAMRTKNSAYRSAVAVALAAAVILAWLSLGVGVIGADGDPANLMYFGVLAIGVIGAAIAGCQPHGMARALFAMAIAQALVAAIALVAGLGYPASPPLEILILNGFFVALFVGSALLFSQCRAGKAALPEALTG